MCTWRAGLENVTGVSMEVKVERFAPSMTANLLLTVEPYEGSGQIVAYNHQYICRVEDRPVRQ